jgi:hypothetical protein
MLEGVLRKCQNHRGVLSRPHHMFVRARRGLRRREATPDSVDELAHVLRQRLI